MIITGLEVSGIGRFREGVRLVGLGEGVNVLAAANEAGKSTLFKAARACFFQRHTSTQGELARLGTLDAELPARVAVSFRHGGRDYRIEKRFLRGARASLSENGRPLAEGRQADDRLWEILGLRATRLGIEDEAAFGLLWVGQSGSFRLDAPSADAAHLLGGLVAAELGAVEGGERAKAVLERVEAELGHLETAKERKPKAGGPWATALRRRDELRVQEAELRRRLTLLDEDFSELAACQAELGRRSHPGLRAEHERRWREAQAALDEAARAADRLDRRLAEAEAASGRRSSLEERRRRLAEAAGRVAASRQAIARFEEGLARLDAEAARAHRRVNEAASRLAEADRALAALAREGEMATRLERAAEAAEPLDDLIARRDEARSARARLHEIEAELGAIRAGREEVRAAEALAAEIAGLRAAREAAAARLTITLGPGAGGEVLVDDRPIGGEESRAVLAPTRISVADLATVTITPAADAATAPRLAEAERRFAEILARAGLASLDEGREALARAEALRSERAALARQIAALAKGPGGEDALTALEARIARASGLVRQALKEAGLAVLPAPASLAGRRAEIEAAAGAGRAERAAAAHAHEAARAALQQLNEQRSGEAARLEAERLALAQALRTAPDESRDADLARLAADLDQARTAEEEATSALRREQASAPGAEALAGLKRRAERLAQALENHDLERIDLEKRVHALEVGIARDGGAGLGEEHAAAAAELELAEREAARREDEVAALRLLRDMIQDGLARSRDRLLAPVRQHLRPFLADLFPDADLELAEDYTPRSLARAGLPERHDLLSEGTREQIAVLVRLGLGSLLAAKGEPVPVILDDALVFSDDSRIDRMFDALQRAGRNHQVIVLTCRGRAFEPLGGRLLRVEPVGG